MNRRLQDWLTSQAEQRPGACAVVFRRQRTTYGQLDEASNRLARALRAAGCVRGDRVALLLPKSVPALVAIFGTLKADCICVPLDIAAPAWWLARTLRSAGCGAILGTRSTVLAELVGHGELPESTRIGWMDAGIGSERGVKTQFDWRDVLRFPPSAVDSLNTGADPAHILFEPGVGEEREGVVITHFNVIRFVEWAVERFGIDASDRNSGVSPLHSDVSTFEIYRPVAAGAQIHLLAPELSPEPRRLAAFIREAELTQWVSTPSVLEQMAKADVVRWRDFPALRRALWCGQEFSKSVLTYWMGRLPHVNFVELHGPAEATVAADSYCLAAPAASLNLQDW